jgi:hypothetical protein
MKSKLLFCLIDQEIE